MIRKFALILFCISVPLLQLKGQQLVEGIVAVVGDEIILKSEVEQYVYNYALQNRIDLKQNTKLLNNLKKQTLDRLIEQKLLLVKAEEDTITVEDEVLDQRVDQRMRYLIEQAGSEDRLEEMFGGSISKIRRDTRQVVKEQMLVEQVRQLQFRGINVSRREIENFYKTYKDSLPALETTVDISHILMSVKPAEEAQIAAYNKAEQILEQIKNGADFSELASKYSEDPASAKRGGDLGLISRGDFVTEFESAAFKLKDGEISDIVQTQFGYHIIKMMERRGEKIRTKHILIRVAPTEADEARTIEKLREIRQRILDGEDFAELALEYSDDENVAQDKGHLGVFEVDKLVIPEFKKVVSNLKPGEISQPFKTDFGYHIVRLEDRQGGRDLSLESDWQRIEEFALNMKMEKEYRKWIENLRGTVPIDIRGRL